MNDTAINYGMKINVQKTKTMVVRRNGGGVVNITVDGKRIEQVKSFRYLGLIITEDGRSDVDVKSRIAMAKDAFNQRKDLLTRGLSSTLKKRMIKVMVWPVALYGSETWMLLQDEINRLQALEMWLWRGLKKRSWSDKIKNEEMLKRGEEKLFDQNDKSKEEELDRTCVERGWVIEGCDGRESDGEKTARTTKERNDK